MIFLQKQFLLFAFLAVVPAFAEGWSEPAEVRHDDQLCITYRARWDGEYAIVQAAIEPGWHTFAMDNKQRQDEKLAGKQSLGAERPTTIQISGALQLGGAWLQTAPKDFSKPELRWFTWGFEESATFAAKARKTSTGPAEVDIRGQACSDSVCKNVHLTIKLPLENSGGAKLDVSSLTPLHGQ